MFKSLEAFENANDMNNAVQIFTKILRNGADKTLKLKKRGMRNRKLKNPWYDRNCGSLSNNDENLILDSVFTKDEVIRGKNN